MDPDTNMDRTMDTRRVVATAAAWVADNLPQWPGLRAAHLVGGITSLPPDAPFSPTMDVDIHLIFDAGSPALQTAGPFPNIIAAASGGIPIEAGLKSVVEYEAAATVLANPEIAYHLTRDSILVDPSGLLRALQPAVRREYARREWVRARIEHERRGLEAAVGMRPMAAAMYCASGETMLLKYCANYLTGALSVATLAPPRIGARSLVRLGESLAALGRPDLSEAVLAVLGVRDVQPERVQELLEEGARLFDLALSVKRTPHGFDHKMHAHLRPYFVDASAQMIADGFHREALGWIVPYALPSTDIILADGPDNEFARTVTRQERFLRELGMTSVADRDKRYAAAERVFAEVIAVAEEVVAARAEAGEAALFA